MRRLLFLAVILLVVPFLTLPALSQAKHPFTFEDMMKLKRVGEPVPSPDGKWVLFSAVDVDLATNKKTPHIWIVPLRPFQMVEVREKISRMPHVSRSLQDMGEERVLVPDQDGDRPRWAPDGKRFAFLSNKDGSSQAWIADFDGSAGAVTAVHKLTSIPTEASGELWSPDGKNILFTSDIYPECDGASADEANCNARKLKEAEESKVKAITFDRLLYRHWNSYKRGMRTHIFLVRAELPKPARIGDDKDKVDGFPIPRDLTPGDYDAPVFSLGGQDNYAFSPDGQEICYTSNHDKVEATSTNNDLWIVPVNGGAAKNITADNPASDSTPLYSPDGKYIAYRAQQRPGYESDRFRLMLYERKTGEKDNLTENFDRWIGTIAWASDSSRVYFTAENGGNSSIHELQIYVAGKAWPRQVAGGFNDDLAVLGDGHTLVFTRMSLSMPNEIYRTSSAEPPCTISYKDGKFPPPGYEAPNCQLSTAEPLTHLNDAVLSQVSMSPIESFWFKGAKNDRVQGFLVKPPNFDSRKKYPLKFIIHGGPEVPMGDLWSYRWNAELFAASGYVVIMINFHGSPGYGQRFIDEINGDWGGSPFEDLMKGLDYAEKTYPFIDKDRECALGASYGGYMANWVLGHTDRFKCIVSHDGMFNTYSAWGTTEEVWFNNWEFKGTPYTNPEMYEKWNPRNAAKNFKTPTLVIHSQLDYRLDVSEGFQLFTTLQTMGVPSKMLYFPDEGHWILKPQNSQLWYKTVNDWVDQWTKK
jgi:dipeptidyl aminopeptidase/acylaminoacyl peptidase